MLNNRLVGSFAMNVFPLPFPAFFQFESLMNWLASITKSSSLSVGSFSHKGFEPKWCAYRVPMCLGFPKSLYFQNMHVSPIPLCIHCGPDFKFIDEAIVYMRTSDVQNSHCLRSS